MKPRSRRTAMTSQQSFPNLTIGLDLGDKVSQTCEIDAAGKVVKRAAVATTPGAIERYFGGRPRCRIALEVSTHSTWVSRQLEAMGHEVIVANTSTVYAPITSCPIVCSWRDTNVACVLTPSGTWSA